MKMKARKLIALIALLLVGSILLTACNDPEESGENPYTPQYNYSTDAKTWANYISYKAEEPIKTAYTATAIAQEADGGTVIGDILITTVNKDVFTNDATPVKTERVTTYTWYNVNTGEVVRTLTSRSPVITAGKVDESISPAAIKTYTQLSYHGLIEVKAQSYALKEIEADQDPLDTAAIASYDTVTTYSYYLADGTELVKDLKERLAYRDATNTSCALLDCKAENATYLMKGEDLLYTFEYKMEYDIPDYDETKTNVNGTGYAYFEKNGNKYVIKEAAHVSMPISDTLSLVLVPGISINVTDADDKPLVSYSAECYGICGYAVLSNGNIYICEYELLDKDAEAYDIKSDDQKMNINHKIINVADGSVSSLDLAYTTSKLFNNTTPEIKSFLNAITMELTDFQSLNSSLLSSVSVKNGYLLAEIRKYENGVLSADTVYAVLDENLAIVAELPKIIANQFTYPGFMNATTMVVSTRTTTNAMVYYAVDLTSGEATLLPSLQALSNIEPINNGYVWWKGSTCKIYDAEWQLLKDFTVQSNDNNYKEVSPRIINGDVYFLSYYDNSANDDQFTPNYTVKKCMIVKENSYSNGSRYTLSDFSIADSAKFYGEALILKGSNTNTQYYTTLDGEYLFGNTQNNRVDLYSAELGTDVNYSVSKTVTGITETDVGFLVCTKVTYTKDSYLTPSDLDNEFVKYEYSLIK